jgi:hypothetical protein
MRRTTLVWSVCAAALLPAFTAGSAIASDPSTLQDAGQVATNDQSADSRATSTQDRPTNTNIQVSILSPGAGGGSVAQTNASEAHSSAGNEAATAQRAAQHGGTGGRQDAGQAASNDQDADSEATSEQDHPSNTNIQVSILSPGAGGGSVRQGNGSKAKSAAGSRNATDQAAEQAGGHRSGGTPATGQKAHNEQDADSEATSEQDHPANVNIVVAILSPGAGGGPVDQANVSSAESEAGNANGTTQASRQHPDDGGRGAVQSTGQLAESEQDAGSEATSEQDGAQNARGALGSRGGRPRDGGARQVNASTAKSASGSTNATTQDARQSAARSGGFAAHAVQALGQKAVNEQDADSDATSEQDEPLNLHLGSGGALSQDNVSRAGSTAANENETAQRAAQALGAVAALE